MNLVVDIGNTVNKYAVFQNDTIVFQAGETRFKADDLLEVIRKFQIDGSILSAVNDFDPYIEEVMWRNGNYIKLGQLTPIPITNKYLSPETLGNDRLAAAVGANMKFPRANVLSIDAGTCIKYDFVNSDNEYMGGGISPGLGMRLQAMHNFTARLPLIDALSSNNNTPVELTGNSTSSSMLSGTYNGALFEVEGMIDHYSSQYGNLTVVISGGDHRFFELHVKRKIFALPNLVLEGLNRILNFNLNKN
ncbi:MAG: type III pantothenate kinase [Chitinophagales bacterium]